MAKLVGDLIEQHATDDSDGPSTMTVCIACMLLSTVRRSVMLWRVAAHLATTLAKPPPQVSSDGTIGHPDSEWDVLAGNFADIRGRLAMADTQNLLTKVEQQALKFYSTHCEVAGENKTKSAIKDMFPSLFDV